VLLEAAAGATRADLLADPRRPLSPEQSERLERFLARRERREPVSHILGRKGFWSIMLQVGPQVLTPRPETELIVSAALDAFAPDTAFVLLDLGVGSGAIALAILVERTAARGLGVDASEAALAVARENAANLGLSGRLALLRGDWATGLDNQSFDLVVCNPPYVRSEEIAVLDPEVRDYEPRLALDGGPDGLDAYRRLAPEILRVLKPGGRFLLEIGQGQAAAVTSLFQAAGGEGLDVLRDLAGRDRVVAGSKKALGISADNR
jgi:release factor glutamine methyltransferase